MYIKILYKAYTIILKFSLTIKNAFIDLLNKKILNNIIKKNIILITKIYLNYCYNSELWKKGFPKYKALIIKA